MTDTLLLAIIGLCAGLLGGMLGIGGSIVMIPAMTEVLGPDQHLYQSAAMIVTFFVVVPAVYQHRRAGVIDRSTVMRIVPAAVPAVVVGVCLSELPVFSGSGEAYLRGLFGMFLFLASGYDLYRLFRDRGALHDARAIVAPSGAGEVRCPWRHALLIALPTGLVAGLLGVGGGLLAVPLQRRVLRLPMRVAIANSAAIIIPTSLVGATAKNLAYFSEHGSTVRPFILAAVLIPTAILGSLSGSRLTHQLPVRTIKGAFLVLLVAASVRLMRGAL